VVPQANPQTNTHDTSQTNAPVNVQVTAAPVNNINFTVPPAAPAP
ncbi:22388_t:CDS:1, partial [Racocetra persica]